MSNWDENEKPEFMHIAYSSERSIEDELDRVSHAEIPTAVGSYVIMLVYIAVSLGKVRSFATLLVCFFY